MVLVVEPGKACLLPRLAISRISSKIGPANRETAAEDHLQGNGCNQNPSQAGQDIDSSLSKPPPHRQEQITENKAPSALTRDVIVAEVAQYQKSLPKDERKQERAKPKMKKDPKEAARERCHELVEKLKTATGILPQARDILKLLDRLEAILDQEK